MQLARPTLPLVLLLAYHVVLSVALGFVFTPIFTNSLNDLTPNLYSHGSAMLGTMQQVGGAAGTALLITVMTSRSAVAAQAGADQADALHVGLQTAFWVAAGLSSTVVVLALFTRRAAPAEGAHAPVGAH